MSYADTGMGMEGSQNRGLARLGQARDGFVEWLRDNPRHAMAWLGSVKQQELQKTGTVFVQIASFTLSCKEARDAMRECRALRGIVVNREENALRYAAAKKMVWFAQGKPVPKL